MRRLVDVYCWVFSCVVRYDTVNSFVKKLQSERLSVMF